MEKLSKLSLKIFSIIIATTIIYSFAAMYLHDPLQIWHPPFFRKEKTYSYTIRESARAMIRDNEFDSIIIGNSYSENTSCKEAEKIFGGKFLNLSMSGSTTFEKRIILNYLLNRKKLNRVIYILDGHYVTLKTAPQAFNPEQYEMLYNENPLDDFKVYLNSKYFFRTLHFSNSKKCIGTARDMDRPYSWESSQAHRCRFGGLQNWIDNKHINQVSEYFQEILTTPMEINKTPLDNNYRINMQKFYDDNLFSMVAKSPDTQFDFIVSPVSDIALAIKLRASNQNFAKYSATLKYLVSQQEKYKNFRIYAFNDDSSFSRIEDYKDGSHYRTEINYRILNSIKERKHEINAQNIDSYLDAEYKKALSVNFEYYYNLIRNL